MRFAHDPFIENIPLISGLKFDENFKRADFDTNSYYKIVCHYGKSTVPHEHYKYNHTIGIDWDKCKDKTIEALAAETTKELCDLRKKCTDDIRPIGHIEFFKPDLDLPDDFPNENAPLKKLTFKHVQDHVDLMLPDDEDEDINTMEESLLPVLTDFYQNIAAYEKMLQEMIDANRAPKPITS
jgi:hypothetical protein